MHVRDTSCNEIERVLGRCLAGCVNRLARLYEGEARFFVFLVFLVFFGDSGLGGGGASNCSANSRSDEGGAT
jgi:hypothetical protein